MTSGYFPMGAMIANEKLYEPFRYGTTSFLHGFTFGGHPAGAAIALANLDIFEREGINEHVRSLEVTRHANAWSHAHVGFLTSAGQVPFQKTLEKLYDIPIVGDIRGAGFFWGIEMVKNRETRESFNSDESEQLLRGFLSKALFDNGLYAHPLTTPPLFCCFVTCCTAATAEPTTEATPPSRSLPPSSAPRNTSTRLRSHPHSYPATTCASVTAAAPVISNTLTPCAQ